MRLCLTAVILGILAFLVTYGGGADSRYEDELARAFYGVLLYFAGLVAATVSAEQAIRNILRKNARKLTVSIQLLVFGVFCVPLVSMIGSSLLHEDVDIPFSYTITVPGDIDPSGLQIEILQSGTASWTPIYHWQTQGQSVQLKGTDSLRQRRAVIALKKGASNTALFTFLIRFPKDDSPHATFQATAYKGALDLTLSNSFLDGSTDEINDREPTPEASLEYTAQE